MSLKIAIAASLIFVQGVSVAQTKPKTRSAESKVFTISTAWYVNNYDAELWKIIP